MLMLKRPKCMSWKEGVFLDSSPKLCSQGFNEMSIEMWRFAKEKVEWIVACVCISCDKDI